MPRGMPKTAKDRIKKWRARFKPDHWYFVVEATQDIAAERMMYYQADYEVVYRNVKAVLARYPTEAFRTQEYMWYALKLYHCLRVYKSKALVKCANAATISFAVLGLNVNALYEIANSLGVKPDPLDVIAGGLGILVGRPKVVNRAVGPVTVTNTQPETVLTIYEEDIVYVEGVHITASNPVGSGTSLHLRPVIVHSLGRTPLSDYVTVPEGQAFDDWLRFLLDSVPDDAQVNGVELEAYVGLAPPTGNEPQVQLQVVGVRLART